MRKPGQAIFERVTNRLRRQKRVKPFPTVHETVFGKPPLGAALTDKERKARAEYRSKMTLDDKAGELAQRLSFYIMFTIFLLPVGVVTVFGLPRRFNNSRFKGRIELGLLFWLITIYTSTFVFAFNGRELLGASFGGLFFLTLGVLFWLGRNDHWGDFQIPPMNK